MEYSPDVERIARVLAEKHFRRKKHYGHCTQDERVSFMVNKHWRNYADDAQAVIQEMRLIES